MFSAAVRDLKEMEETGIHGPDGSIVRGTVIAITGDNLGSHCIGGFTENFSKSRYFCRYCLIDRESFQQTPTKSGPARSVETYNNSVAQASLQEGMANGVKFDSVFNSVGHVNLKR